jgi:hypothetical protein
VTAPAHEEVRCLDRRLQPYPLEGADQDFLIIDDRWVMRLLYDDHHRLAMGLMVAAGAIDRYRFVRDVFWSAATGRGGAFACDPGRRCSCLSSSMHPPKRRRRRAELTKT